MGFTFSPGCNPTGLTHKCSVVLLTCRHKQTVWKYVTSSPENMKPTADCHRSFVATTMTTDKALSSCRYSSLKSASSAAVASWASDCAGMSVYLKAIWPDNRHTHKHTHTHTDKHRESEHNVMLKVTNLREFMVKVSQGQVRPLSFHIWSIEPDVQK